MLSKSPVAWSPALTTSLYKPIDRCWLRVKTRLMSQLPWIVSGTTLKHIFLQALPTRVVMVSRRVGSISRKAYCNAKNLWIEIIV